MADYAKMLVSELRKRALELFEEDDVKGLRKAQLVELLEKNDAEDEAADEVDDELDDEVDDTDDELDDEEEDDEEQDEVPAPKSKANDAPKGHKPDTTRQTPPEPTGDTLTAKQVATRLGTDAKTLRKFFRSGASDFKAVGQGGRYEFAKDDLPAIKAAFEKYSSGKTTRTKRDPSEKAKPTGRMATAVEELEDEDEPELEDLDDLELDDDEELELEDDDELDE